MVDAGGSDAVCPRSSVEVEVVTGVFVCRLMASQRWCDCGGCGPTPPSPHTSQTNGT